MQATSQKAQAKESSKLKNALISFASGSAGGVGLVAVGQPFDITKGLYLSLN